MPMELGAAFEQGGNPDQRPDARPRKVEGQYIPTTPGAQDPRRRSSWGPAELTAAIPFACLSLKERRGPRGKPEPSTVSNFPRKFSGLP